MFQINIERSVLASYLLVDMTEDAFKDNRKPLDIELFTNPFHKRVAIQINEALRDDIPLPLLTQKLDDKLSKSTYAGNYQNEFMEITSVNPLSGTGLDKYIDVLVQKKIERLL